jgi:hypothetical protein
MTDRETSILSCLAMLKVADNVNDRFAASEKQLQGDALAVAKAIRNNDRSCLTAKSMLEWAESELGLNNS